MPCEGIPKFANRGISIFLKSPISNLEFASRNRPFFFIVLTVQPFNVFITSPSTTIALKLFQSISIKTRDKKVSKKDSRQSSAPISLPRLRLGLRPPRRRFPINPPRITFFLFTFAFYLWDALVGQLMFFDTFTASVSRFCRVAVELLQTFARCCEPFPKKKIPFPQKPGSIPKIPINPCISPILTPKKAA